MLFDHQAVVFPRAALTVVFRQQVLDLVPLFIRELLGRGRNRHLALLG
jgi:hypothetical protein